MGENVFGIVALIPVCGGHKSNRGDDDGGAGPVKAGFVDQVEVFGTKDVDAHTDEHYRCFCQYHYHSPVIILDKRWKLTPETQDGLPLVGDVIFLP